MPREEELVAGDLTGAWGEWSGRTVTGKEERRGTGVAGDGEAGVGEAGGLGGVSGHFVVNLGKSDGSKSPGLDW